jgi:prolipoprotein diacylglyceryltransferase
MGMLLSLPMIALGLAITVLAFRRAGGGDGSSHSRRGSK